MNIIINILAAIGALTLLFIALVFVLGIVMGNDRQPEERNP